MIFDIVSHIHTRSRSCQKKDNQKVVLQLERGAAPLYCRTKFFMSCPASCKVGRLSNNVLQNAGQNEKKRPAIFSGVYAEIQLIE